MPARYPRFDPPLSDIGTDHPDAVRNLVVAPASGETTASTSPVATEARSVTSPAPGNRASASAGSNAGGRQGTPGMASGSWLCVRAEGPVSRPHTTVRRIVVLPAPRRRGFQLLDRNRCAVIAAGSDPVWARASRNTSMRMALWSSPEWSVGGHIHRNHVRPTDRADRPSRRCHLDRDDPPVTSLARTFSGATTTLSPGRPPRARTTLPSASRPSTTPPATARSRSAVTCLSGGSDGL